MRLNRRKFLCGRDKPEFLRRIELKIEINKIYPIPLYWEMVYQTRNEQRYKAVNRFDKYPDRRWQEVYRDGAERAGNTAY